MPGGVVMDSTAIGDYSQAPTSPPAGVTATDIPIVTPVVPVPTLVNGRPQ